MLLNNALIHVIGYALRFKTKLNFTFREPDDKTLCRMKPGETGLKIACALLASLACARCHDDRRLAASGQGKIVAACGFSKALMWSFVVGRKGGKG